MMKTILLISIFCTLCFAGRAQFLTIEKLTEKVSRHPAHDTLRVNLLNQLAKRNEISPDYRDTLLNESLMLSRMLNYLAGEACGLTVKAQYSEVGVSADLSRQAVACAEKSGNSKAIFYAYRSLAESMLNTSENTRSIDYFRKALQVANLTGDAELIIAAHLGMVDYYKNVVVNYPVALEWGLKALQTAEYFHDTTDLAIVYRNIGAVYVLIGDQEKSLENLQKALTASRHTGDNETMQYTLNDIGERYRLMNRYPEALQAYSEASLLIKDAFNIELNQSNVADVYQRMGNNPMCFKYGFQALSGAKQLKDTIGIAWINNILSRAYLKEKNIDSALWYGLQGYDYSIKTQLLEYVRDNSEALSNTYAINNNYDRAFYYYKIFISSRDSMLNNEVTNKTRLAQYNYDLEKKQSEIRVLSKDKQLQEVLVQRQRILLTATIIGLLLIIISLVIVYRQYVKRQRAYILLNAQKQEIQNQRDQTSQALNDLKLAQSRLIHSEKMASLGELTAGIAHEIQNPLNFVNNFSEVTNELIEELKSERSKSTGNRIEKLEEELLNNIAQNLEKINHHGKRADGIVKGMLQHSRSSTAVKVPTDMNELADEYLRLSYHGLRAKDKSFNTTLKTDFDGSIEKINVIPQDIGRVLLNLLTNAFYAVSERKEHAGAGYEPKVSVTTKRLSTGILITIADNGSGIPQKVIDKIFQPFFTTKPAGQGTGLGLSLSYDIIKAHGGEIDVHTEVDEGTTFLILLPV